MMHDHEHDQEDGLLGRLMRENALEPETGEEFDQKVLRAWRLRRGARTLRFWTPAIVGATVTGLALLALLQLLIASPSLKRLELRGQEARYQPSELPTFEESEVTYSR